MTLSTNIYVLDPVDPEELFRFGQSLLAEYDEQHRSAEAQAWRRGEPDANGRTSIYNRLGQGLPAILDVRYRNGGQYVTAEMAGHDEDCDEDCTGKYHDRECWIDVDLDTAYGYRDERGWGCGDLHAVLVARIGNWLDERGVRWEWRNEFTGDVHGDDDRYARLADLASGGFEAEAWFRTAVLPAILSGEIGGAA